MLCYLSHYKTIRYCYFYFILWHFFPVINFIIILRATWILYYSYYLIYISVFYSCNYKFLFLSLRSPKFRILKKTFLRPLLSRCIFRNKNFTKEQKCEVVRSPTVKCIINNVNTDRGISPLPACLSLYRFFHFYSYRNVTISITRQLYCCRIIIVLGFLLNKCEHAEIIQVSCYYFFNIAISLLSYFKLQTFFKNFYFLYCFIHSHIL